jgi:hypothetical protein
MLTFMRTRSGALTASPSAVRERALRNSSPSVSEARANTPAVEAALDEHPTSHRHQRIPGGIGRIGSLQSPFNPHTSTALAA